MTKHEVFVPSDLPDIIYTVFVSFREGFDVL